MPRKKKKTPVFDLSYHYSRADHWAESVIEKMRDLPELTCQPKTRIAKMLGITIQTYDNIINYRFASTTMPWPCINVIERYYDWALRHRPYFQAVQERKRKKYKKVVYLNADNDNVQNA